MQVLGADPDRRYQKRKSATWKEELGNWTRLLAYLPAPGKARRLFRYVVFCGLRLLLCVGDCDLDVLVRCLMRYFTLFWPPRLPIHPDHPHNQIPFHPITISICSIATYIPPTHTNAHTPTITQGTQGTQDTATFTAPAFLNSCETDLRNPTTVLFLVLPTCRANNITAPMLNSSATITEATKVAHLQLTI
jgi:hypothetical protein